MKSKWTPTRKQLGQLARAYPYPDCTKLIFGKNGAVMMKRKGT